MNVRHSASRGYTYFRRGHNVYLSLLMWGINTITVVYVLLSTEVPLIRVLFPTIGSFALVFGLAYVLICTVSGWHDYNQGTWVQESAIHFQNNPEWVALKKEVAEIKRDVKDLVDMISEMKIGVVKRILEDVAVDN